jgi:hypothetical protein
VSEHIVLEHAAVSGTDLTEGGNYLGVGVAVDLGLHGVLLLARALVLGLGLLNRRLRRLKLAQQLLSVGLELLLLVMMVIDNNKSVPPKEKVSADKVDTNTPPHAHGVVYGGARSSVPPCESWRFR